MNTVQLEYYLYIDCPNCEKELDLTENRYNYDYRLSRKIFTNKWEEVKGFEVCCEYCSHEFELDGVEY